jgi:hypothetical protein
MAKHEKTFVDFDQPYEQNIIGLRGIIYFGLGLFLLIVVTFGLMWVLQYQVLQPNAEEADRANENPLALSADEKLPPEPRLQTAPGFGIDDPRTKTRMNLELREPQAEYRELQKQWEDLWVNGEKNEQTGTVIALPIEEAKKKLLAGGGIKSASGEAGEKALEEARMMVSESSSGRTATVRKR